MRSGVWKCARPSKVHPGPFGYSGGRANHRKELTSPPGLRVPHNPHGIRYMRDREPRHVIVLVFVEPFLVPFRGPPINGLDLELNVASPQCRTADRNGHEVVHENLGLLACTANEDPRRGTMVESTGLVRAKLNVRGEIGMNRRVKSPLRLLTVALTPDSPSI